MTKLDRRKFFAVAVGAVALAPTKIEAVSERLGDYGYFTLRPDEEWGTYEHQRRSCTGWFPCVHLVDNKTGKVEPHAFCEIGGPNKGLMIGWKCKHKAASHLVAYNVAKL